MNGYELFNLRGEDMRFGELFMIFLLTYFLSALLITGNYHIFDLKTQFC